MVLPDKLNGSFVIYFMQSYTPSQLKKLKFTLGYFMTISVHFLPITFLSQNLGADSYFEVLNMSRYQLNLMSSSCHNQHVEIDVEL